MATPIDKNNTERKTALPPKSYASGGHGFPPRWASCRVQTANPPLGCEGAEQSQSVMSAKSPELFCSTRMSVACCCALPLCCLYIVCVKLNLILKGLDPPSCRLTLHTAVAKPLSEAVSEKVLFTVTHTEPLPLFLPLNGAAQLVHTGLISSVAHTDDNAML